jgi:hypothetical protein
MALTATLYLIDIKDLESIGGEVGRVQGKKKSLLGWAESHSERFFKKLELLAVEKIVYRFSGMAFPILAVFSKEKLYVDWDNLEYSRIANDFSGYLEAGIFIFSIKDEGLLRLRPDAMFYSLHDLDRFAVAFAGGKPANPDIMKDAVGFLNSTLSKLTPQRVILLALE